MGVKSELQARAEELGVEFVESDTIATLREKISAVEDGDEIVEEAVSEEPSEAVAGAEGDLFDVRYLEMNSQALFGQPRSVFVGALSAGLIQGDRVSKEAAAEGVRAFLSYEGGS